MTDGLTQLQDAVHQLETQLIASLFYINKHHGFSTLGPKDAVRPEARGEVDPTEKEHDVDPYPADVYKTAQKQLAQDLILKEQQIEDLISALPGLDNSEKDQDRMMRHLEEQIKTQEEIHKLAVKDHEATLARLESVISGIKRP